MTRILNIPIDAALLARWSGWLAPERQPFFLTVDEAKAYGLAAEAHPDFTPEQRDTFQLWNVSAPLVARLDEAAFLALPATLRRELVEAQLRHKRGAVAQAGLWRDVVDTDEAHFVWWPSTLAGREALVFTRLLAEERLPCRHAEVPEAVWTEVAPLLPRARELASTFASSSGPNCFGTVMAAAGVAGAEYQWMQREPFEMWLAACTVAGGDPSQPGGVLVWRDGDGLAQHAAISLGRGYALHKPSQGWDSPRQVLRLDEVQELFAKMGALNLYTLNSLCGARIPHP